MFKAIGHNLARLAQFSGRDARGTFWPYALTLFALTILGTMLAIVPVMFDAMARMQRFAAQHPELTTVEQGPGSYSIRIEGRHPELMPDMHGAMTGIAMVAAIFVLLIAAAVVRRLHDRGSSGLWALPPLAFLAIGLVATPRMMASAGTGVPDPSLFLLLFASNILYLASLGWLVILLARDGTPGPNRHGEDPTPAEVRQRRRAPPQPRR